MLHAHLLLSDHAHARILSVDTRAAEQVPGVIAVLSANNTPIPLWQRISRPGAVCPHKARHRGEVIAAVAAQDAATAAEAVRCITVQYEPLPAVVDVLDAIQPEAPIVHEDLASYPGVNLQHIAGNICYRTSVAWGNVEAGFAQADRLYEHTFRTSTVHQGYLEPMATVAQVEPNGKVTVWTSTQSTHGTRASGTPV